MCSINMLWQLGCVFNSLSLSLAAEGQSRLDCICCYRQPGSSKSPVIASQITTNNKHAGEHTA